MLPVTLFPVSRVESYLLATQVSCCPSPLHMSEVREAVLFSTGGEGMGGPRVLWHCRPCAAQVYLVGGEQTAFY